MLPSGWPSTDKAPWAVRFGVVRSFPLFGVAALLSVNAAVLIAPAVAVSAAREPEMRVLLLEGQRLTLRADGSLPMQVRGIPGGIRALQRLELRLGSGGLNVLMDGARTRLAVGTALEVENDDPRGIWLGQRRYRGALQISSRGGQLRVVNQLGIETYLASVVGSEMPHQWPLAALQAQAVAARTYALRQKGRGGGWDVKATVASQVYRGVESETASTREAVNSTRALVLVHGGRLIDAVFHSSSGGRTEASGMVWRQQLPYLVSVPDHDQHSPVHSWQKRFDSETLRKRLPETGGLEDVSVLTRSASGRVRQARIQGPRGSLVMSGRELRRRLGLKSTLVQFELVSGQIPSRPSLHTRLQPLPAIQVSTPASSGTRSRIDRITASVAAVPPPSDHVLRLPVSTVRPRGSQTLPEDGVKLLVRGQGFGHGVGMSQWGAHGLAQQGADFRTILRHYYKGADVVPFRSYFDPSLARPLSPAPLWRG